MAGRQLALATIAALVSLATACSDGARGDTRSTGGSGGVEGTITVFAAASLSNAFTDLGEAFTEANPDAKAELSFDASSALVTQIAEGAPADVFASADVVNMDRLVDAGLHDGEPLVFATNLLTIVVAPGNPEGITGVADLANPDLVTVICAAEVPCGRYAGEIFTNAGVTVTPASFEQNVRGVITKVTAGEADAGIVYVTDVTAAGDAADMVEIPEGINVVATYPIVKVKDAGNAEVSDAFIELLTGPTGQEIMAEHGFGAP